MNTLDIVNLIENNPITRLSDTYNNKLLLEIKNNFTNEQQQFFLSIFYSFMNYDEITDYVIDLDNIWHWLGYSQKDAIKRTLEKNFKIDIDYKINSIELEAKKQGRGGHNKETILLNINTFKLLCLKADTEKAKQIREYFISLERILIKVIQEESNDFKLKLTQLKSEKETEYKNKLIIDNALNKEKLLLTEYGTKGPLVYIIKVKSYDDGTYVIKIGESRKGIHGRYSEHKTNYEECLLLDCFITKKSNEFERFLHHHDDIKFNKVTDLKGHENEKELFLIGKNLSYKTVLKIINTNIKHYDETNFEMNTLKNLVISLSEKTVDNNLFTELINNENKLLSIVENLQKSNLQLEKTNKEILEKLNKLEVKTTTNFNEPLKTLGPRLQKINDETKQIVKVYETVTELLKENSKYKRPSIEKAVKENTIYHQYRFMYVDRDLDPNRIYDMKPTRQIQTQEVGYVAKLPKDKSKILNVYLDKKTAAKMNDYGISGLDNHVKNETLTKEHYYILYEKCSDELKNNFEIPILYKDGIGQYDSNNNLIKEHTCKFHCMKANGISDKSLNKALEKNIMYDGYYYKHLGEKLMC
jgi:phage anti-repressor protein